MQESENTITLLLVLIVSCIANNVGAQGYNTRRADLRLTSFGPNEMASIGNCIPRSFSSIEIEFELDVASSRIQALGFLSTEELIVLTRSNELISYDIKNDVKYRFPTLNGLFADIGPIIEGEFLLLGNRYFDEEHDIERSVVCYDNQGNLLWDIENIIMGRAPIFYDGKYYFASDRYMVNNSINEINPSGVFPLLIIDPGDTWYPELIAGEDSLIWYGIAAGPLIVNIEDEGELTLSDFESDIEGVMNLIHDAADRIALLDFDTHELVVIDKETATTSTINYLHELGLQEQHPLTSWGKNYLASTGEKIVILFENKLITYEDTRLRLWHDSLNKLVSRFEPTCLYIDEAGDHFIIANALSKEIIYGGEDVRAIQFDGIRTTPITFSEDFKYAAFGTRTGKIYILELH